MKNVHFLPETASGAFYPDPVEGPHPEKLRCKNKDFFKDGKLRRRLKTDYFFFNF